MYLTFYGRNMKLRFIAKRLSGVEGNSPEVLLIEFTKDYYHDHTRFLQLSGSSNNNNDYTICIVMMKYDLIFLIRRIMH